MPPEQLTLKVPGSAGVTSFANTKIIAAKRALAVVTRHATQSPAGRVMIQRFRRGHLPALWHARSYLVALIASYFLMLCMTKADAKCLRRRWGARVAA